MRRKKLTYISLQFSLFIIYQIQTLYITYHEKPTHPVQPPPKSNRIKQNNARYINCTIYLSFA